MYYIKNSIEIIKSGENDPDLLLMAKTTINNRLNVIEPYIKECIDKGIKPVIEILNEYTDLNALNIRK
jgi:hypothetical protein